MVVVSFTSIDVKNAGKTQSYDKSRVFEFKVISIATQARDV